MKSKRDLFKNTVAIRTLIDNAIHYGTGFFVQSGEKIFLVTAAHVALDTTVETDIWLMNLATKMPQSIKLRELNKKNMWIYHTDADLAILKVENKEYDLTQYVIDINLFESDINKVPEREETLVMYGIPELYTKYPFTPFTCDSKPISDLWPTKYQKTGRTYQCFLLDKTIIQGFSGGFVALLKEEQDVRFFGIITGQKTDETGGKFTIILHSAYIFELLNYIK